MIKASLVDPLTILFTDGGSDGGVLVRWRLASIRVECSSHLMKLSEHGVDLAAHQKARDRQIAIKDLIDLLIEASLVKQALNAHFDLELERGLHPKPNLLPAA